MRSQGAVSEVHAFEPNYEGSPIVLACEPLNPVSAARRDRTGSKPEPATTSRPPALASGGNVFDALGEGFALLALGARPDQFVAWSAPEPQIAVAAAEQVLKRARGQVEGAPTL